SPEPGFVTRLDEAMCALWRNEARLPLLGHLWMARWDLHAEALGEILKGSTVSATLRWARNLPPILATRTWESVARVLEVWRWHDRLALSAARTQDLADVLVESLRGPHAEAAVGLGMHWRAHPGGPAGEELPGLRERIIAVLPDVPEPIRRAFHPW